MVDINAFEPLRALPDEVLNEIVREGEVRIEAQLSTATAADQRALTLAGFQIASASAALAGGGALIVGNTPNAPLAYLALTFAIAMTIATIIAIRTVRPAVFDLPGNSPGGWLPDKWMGAGLHPPTLKQARIEQADCLDASIADNTRCAEIAARNIHRSMDLTLITVSIAAMAMLLIVLLENRRFECASSSFPFSRMPSCRSHDGGQKPRPSGGHPLVVINLRPATATDGSSAMTQGSARTLRNSSERHGGRYNQPHATRHRVHKSVQPG